MSLFSDGAVEDCMQFVCEKLLEKLRRGKIKMNPVATAALKELGREILQMARQDLGRVPSWMHEFENVFHE